MRFICSVLAAMLLSILVTPAAEARVEIFVDLQRQHMIVQSGGETLHHWPVSSGRRGYETPSGVYKPYMLTRMHYSRKYDNAPMPHSIFFRGGYAIHATSAISRLGNRASHGCIRLSPANARALYALVQSQGKSATRITISNGGRSMLAYRGAKPAPQRLAEGPGRGVKPSLVEARSSSERSYAVPAKAHGKKDMTRSYAGKNYGKQLAGKSGKASPTIKLASSGGFGSGMELRGSISYDGP